MSTTDLALFSDATDGLDDLSDEHYERLLSGGTGIVVLADISGSMTGRAGSWSRGIGGKSRFQALCEALEPFRSQACVIAFSSDVRELRAEDRLPEPGGGTNVAKAIRHAATKKPARTVLVSDGCPDNNTAAFTEAKKLPGILETIFVGDDNDHQAKKFMRDIASKCGGEFRDLAGDGSEELAPALARLMLPP